MLRGIRWQLLAFIAALCLFVVALLSRSDGEIRYVPENPTTPATEQAPVSTAIFTPETSDTGITEEIITPDTPITAQAETLPAQLVTIAQDDLPTYREALIGQVQRINPLLASLNPIDADLSALIFEGLFRVNNYGEVEPALADSWMVSSDGLEYVVELRQDVLWQDGIPFTADDVAFTMSLLRAQDFPGAKELGNFWQTVETATLNTHTVRFRLSQPLGGFLEALRIGILPAHALQGTTAAQLATHPFNLSPIGTGAYQLEALRTAPDSTGQIKIVDLRAAPVYRQRPEGSTGYQVERLSFYLYADFDQALQALQNGEVDALAGRNRKERSPLLKTVANGITIRNGIEPTVGMLIYNWTDENLPVFKELRVRQALQMGLDRNFIERNLLNLAIRADSPVVMTSWAYHPELTTPAYDLNRARDLLASASLDLKTPEPEPEAETEAPEGETPENAPAIEAPEAPTNNALFAFAILTPDDPKLIEVANEIANQWRLLNVEVSVEVVDAETYRARLESTDFNAALVELTKDGSADPDVYNFWHQGQYQSGKNYGGADDRVISEILEKARRDSFGINRIRDYREFQERFIERAVAVPLYYPLYTYAINSRVQGVHLAFIGTASDRFINIKEWTITQ